MQMKMLSVLCFIAALIPCARAQDITGTILIKKKLTRPNVTAEVPIYQRGAVVRLGKETQEDPIAYERSHVVVYLEGEGPSADDSTNSIPQVQQLNRRFVPDLVVVPVGSTVSFPNMDPIFHNIYSLSKAKTFDLGSYDKGETRKVAFPKPGIVDAYCHLHPNMAATIVVTPNRWYARPDRNGQFRIAKVTPGHYTIVAWHKSAGFFRKSIIVEDGRDSIADFFIPIDAEPKQQAALDHDLGRASGSR